MKQKAFFGESSPIKIFIKNKIKQSLQVKTFIKNILSIDQVMIFVLDHLTKRYNITKENTGCFVLN